MSNSTPNSTPEKLVARIEALEIKASFADDAIDKLDQVIIRQQAQIDALLQAVHDLRQAQNNSAPTTVRSLRDDLPPHY
ncbi:MAG TPA: SlyX family protein [Burkholderiaceae bacterium]|nr:SlyX family protein [Burkholderiaceae bacterium]